MSKNEYYKDLKIIDDAIRTGDLNKQVLELIKEDSYKNYFFNKIDKIEWFSILKKENHFSAEKAPGPQLGDQEGYYSIPWWNVLTYLEKISGQVKEPDNEKYIDQLLQIITNVSNHQTDNFHTWRSFVTILLNIPKEKLSIDIIKLIPIWLNSKFDPSHVGSDIGLHLLPKFLSDDTAQDDIDKAEIIINYLTEIKRVSLDAERAKLYSRDKEYKLLIEPYWLIKILEENYVAVAETCSNNVISSLSEKIDTLLIQKEARIPLEDNGKAYLLTLSHQERQYTIKAFIADEKVHEYVFMNKEIDLSNIDEWQIPECPLNIFVEQTFITLSGADAFKEINLDVLKKDLYNLYRNYHDKGAYQSFYNKTRDHLSDALEVLTFGLKCIMNIRAKKYVDDTNKILESFFQQNYLFYPKMALYIIGNNLDNYEDLFWNALESDNNYFFYEGSYFGDELKHVLEGLLLISPEHKKQLMEIIDNGPKKMIDVEEKYINLWKQERYHALIKDPDFKNLHDACRDKTQTDAALHDGIGEVKTRWGEGPAPLSKDEILKKLLDNTLPAFLAEFKSKGSWEDAPTVGGLAQMIKECVVEHPGEFTNNLPLFMGSGFIYVYKIIDGIRDAVKNKQNVEWGKILDFIYQYIDRDLFWGDKLVIEKDDFRGGAKHSWIIGAVTELIREGTKAESNGYGEELFESVDRIIYLILSKLEKGKEEEINDYVTHALNSPHGKTIIALIHHALQVARLTDTTNEIKWSEQTKSHYNALLDDEIIESVTMLGRYLPNLFYLDKAWAEEKVKTLYPDSANQYWEAFMDGYLSIGTVYHDLYGLMSPHYEFGRSHDFKKKRDNEHLIQHIALVYLLGFDPREPDEPETLIRKVLDTWKSEQILNVVSFLSSQQRYLKKEPEGDENVVKKIISLWRWLYDNKYKDKPTTHITDDDKKILSALARLTVYLKSIDEESSNWIMLAAPYVNENYNSSLFVEYLDKFDDTDSIKYVGKIYLAMLNHFLPDFEKQHIRSTIEKLYENGLKDNADEICNIYGQNGDDFLRDLYEQYNS